MPVQEEVSMTHEAVVGAYAFEDIGAGIEVVCECGAILLDEHDTELLLFSEISDAVRAHQESCELRGADLDLP